MIPYLNGVDSFLANPRSSNQGSHISPCFRRTHAGTVSRQKHVFPFEVFFRPMPFVKSLHGSGLPGLIPSWISLEREKDNFILSFQ